MVITFLIGAILSGIIGVSSLAFKRNKYTEAIEVISAITYAFCAVFALICIFQ